MNEQVIDRVGWFVDRVCSYLPAYCRDDVKQDIYLKLLIELKSRKLTKLQEQEEFCIMKIPYYKKYFFRKYLNNRLYPLEHLENIAAPMDDNPYKLQFDLDKVWGHLTNKQKQLLAYIMKNGIDSTYEEIRKAMGYKNPSMGMWSIRLLLQKIKRIMENQGGPYIHESRYMRHKKKRENIK